MFSGLDIAGPDSKEVPCLWEIRYWKSQQKQIDLHFDVNPYNIFTFMLSY